MKRFIYLLFLLIVCATTTSCNNAQDYDIKSTVTVLSISTISLLFLVLAGYSNILRDEISNCDEFDENAKKMQQKSKWKIVNKTAPFNLTKVQFGLWTTIISSVYVYLSLFKGDCAITGINKTALVLMGIFAGTAVASTLIDKKEMDENRERHQNKPSQGFFIDILSDANGISLHKFQNFTWTLIAIIVYLYKVSQIQTGCELPELSDTLLALTGISSATYLVLKTKENDPPVPEGTPAPATAVPENTVATNNVTNALQPAVG